MMGQKIVDKVYETAPAWKMIDRRVPGSNMGQGANGGHGAAELKVCVCMCECTARLKLYVRMCVCTCVYVNAALSCFEYGSKYHWRARCCRIESVCVCVCVPLG